MPHNEVVLQVNGLKKRYGPPSRLTDWTLRSGEARSSACSGPTGRASPPLWNASSGPALRMPGLSASWAKHRTRSGGGSSPGSGSSFRTPTIRRRTGSASSTGCSPSCTRIRCRQTGSSPASGLRDWSGRRSPPSPAGSGRSSRSPRAGQPPGAGLPGRADDRARPGRTAERLADSARPARERTHHHPYFPLYGRGRSALRPHPDHGSGSRNHNGHPDGGYEKRGERKSRRGVSGASGTGGLRCIVSGRCLKSN